MVLGFLSVGMPFHRDFFRVLPPIFSTEPVGSWNGWRVTIGPDLCEPLYIAYFVDETGSSEVVKMPFLVYHYIYGLIFHIRTVLFCITTSLLTWFISAEEPHFSCDSARFFKIQRNIMATLSLRYPRKIDTQCKPRIIFSWRGSYSYFFCYKCN